MNHKNTAQQLFNISEDIYKSFYHIVFLEVCRAYQIIPDGLFISKKPCIGKSSDRFLDSWEKDLENTGVNLREVLVKEYVRKLFELINQFKSTINRHIIQEDWLLKTINHLEKLEKKLKHKKLKKLRELCKDNSNLYFACLTRFDSRDEFFDFKHYFSKFYNSFIPDFEKLYYLIHLNDNMNGTLVDCNLDEEILLDFTGFHDEEVLDKQNVTSCDHSESHLSEEGNDLFTLNGRIKDKFVRKNVVNLSKQKLTKAEMSLSSKGLKFFPTSNHINKAKLKMELEAYGRMLHLKWHFRNDEKEFDRNKFKPKSTFNPRNKNAAIEIYLSSLEEKLMSIEIPQKKCSNLTREEGSGLYNLKMTKILL